MFVPGSARENLSFLAPSNAIVPVPHPSSATMNLDLQAVPKAYQTETTPLMCTAVGLTRPAPYLVGLGLDVAQGSKGSPFTDPSCSLSHVKHGFVA